MSIRIFKTNMYAEWRDGGSLSSSSRRRFISYSAVWPQILPIASDFCRPKPRVTRHPALQVRGAVPRTRRRNVAFSLFTYSIPVTCINTEIAKVCSLTHSPIKASAWNTFVTMRFSLPFVAAAALFSLATAKPTLESRQIEASKFGVLTIAPYNQTLKLGQVSCG